MMEEQKLLKRKKRASENDKVSLITACIKLAEYYFTSCQYDLAISEYDKVGVLYKSLKKLIDYAQCNRMIGEAYCHLKQYNKALKHQNIHLRIATEEANKLEEQRAHATIGHTYLTRYEDIQNIEDLRLAEKSFKKSLAICERLSGINQREHMDMTARLFANLAVVDEYLGNYDKAIQLVQKCIDICKTHDIFEQLERGYAILGSVYNKKADYKNAIAQYNLAIEVASRLEDKANLISAVLLAKGDIFIKLSDFSNAKIILLKAYKLKNKNHSDHIEDLEYTLKIVAVMAYTEERLLTLSDDDYKTKKELYEKMGDGASSLKIFAKAIEYYKKMLQAAIDNKEPEVNLGSCYFSLAQTYYDNEQYASALEYFRKYYQVCKNNLKESTSTLLSIAEIMDILGKNSEDVEKIYEQAIALCKQASDNHLEGKTISKYIRYSQKYNLDSKVELLQKELNKLTYYVPSDTESDGPEIQTTSNIGEDINIDDITDVSDDEHELPKTRTTRRRNKAITMKKNAKGETQLHTACINGNYDVAQQLIERGHSIHVRDNCGWLPLHEACNHGHLDIVKLLVEKGASINDRGGFKCDGVTPLHDAAVNGHLEIVEYLMNNGASLISKKDNGETPLHCLQSWRESAQNITAASQTYYELISRRMMEALERSGHACDIVLKDDTHNAALVSESNHVLVNKKNKGINYTLSSSDDELMEIDKLSSEESASDAESIHSGSKATEQYREVMKSLRYRNSNEKNDKKQLKVTKRPALLDSDEVGDDWLDDDLGRMKKRKTFSSFTSTSGIRNTNPVCTTKEQTTLYSPPRQQNNFNVIDFKENHEPSAIRTKKKKRQSSLINAGFTTERSSSPLYSNQIQSQRNQLPQSKHQTKLNTFCEDGKIAEADSTTSPVTQRRMLEKQTSNVSIRSEMDEIILYVDVRINEKLYRVPVPYTSKNTLTIKWLADEAAKRFCRKEYMKPVLELETKNGAVLAEDDKVGMLFPLGVTSAEEVNATIVKWNVPPLIQRYKEACIAMHADENATLSQLLSETSIILNLSNCNFGCKIMKPFCKALNRQTNLHHLDLSGNFMSNECMELLCLSFTSLENLTTLNLSMNLITSDSLHHLANIFSNHPDKSVMENLNYLDLSFNPLGNESLRHLSIITRHLNLRVLKLVDVDFTSEIFEDFSNRNVELYMDYLEELDISENRMDKDDILKFILWTRPANLHTLNVSNNSVTENGLLVEIVRIFEANSTQFWKLKYLNFSRCKITDVEVYELLRLLAGAEHFETLNLSYNENLSSISLRRLFNNEYPMKNLQLEGCLDILKYFEGSKEDSWKLVEKSNIKKLRLSIASQEDTVKYNAIVNMWKQRHFDRSHVVSNKYYVELSVR